MLEQQTGTVCHLTLARPRSRIMKEVILFIIKQLVYSSHDKKESRDGPQKWCCLAN